MRFEYRTWKTRRPAEKYAEALEQGAIETRAFRPYQIQRGQDKGLWTVARYDFR
jgi:hypothetical protein